MNDPNQAAEECHLCRKVKRLVDSHIIPNWVYRDEIRGKGGKMINLSEKRLDPRAYTMKLLCEDCEEKFSRWENRAKLFGMKSLVGSRYGGWLFNFATSISWRVVKYHQQPQLKVSESLQTILKQDYVSEAMDIWANYLDHGVLLPAFQRHQQHMFMVSPNYVARKVIQMIIGNAGPHTFVLSRFSFYSFIGVLNSEKPEELRSSTILPAGGQLRNENWMPAALAHYIAGLEEESSRLARDYVSKPSGK